MRTSLSTCVLTAVNKGSASAAWSLATGRRERRSNNYTVEWLVVESHSHLGIVMDNNAGPSSNKLCLNSSSSCIIFRGEYQDNIN